MRDVNTAKDGKKEKTEKKREPKGHWLYALTEVREIDGLHAGLTPADKSVLTALALRMNPVDKFCFPSQDTLRLDTGYSRTQVQLSTEKLEDMGLIKRKKIKSENGGQYYQYTFNFAEISALHRKNFKELIIAAKQERKKKKQRKATKQPPQDPENRTNSQTKQSTVSVHRGAQSGCIGGHSQVALRKEKESKEELSNENLENLDNEGYQIPVSSSPGDLPCGKDFSPAGFTDSFAATSNSQECNQVHLLKEMGAPVRPDCISAASWKLLEGFRPELMHNREARVRFVCDLIRHHFPKTRKYKKHKPLSAADSNSLHKYFDTYETLTPELLCVGVEQFIGADSAPGPGDLWKHRDSALFAWAESVDDCRVFAYQGEQMNSDQMVEAIWQCRDLNELSLGDDGCIVN